MVPPLGNGEENNAVPEQHVAYWLKKQKESQLKQNNLLLILIEGSASSLASCLVSY